MLGGALQTYLDRYGVVCGNSVVMATTHDGAYQNAIALAQAGLEVSVIDARARLTVAARQALNAGASVQLETVPLNAIGDKAVAAVEIGRIDASGNITRLHRQIGCNVLGVSGGYAPVVNLLSHRGVKPVWNTGINSFLSGKTKEQIYHIGAADGLFSDDAVIASAHILLPESGALSGHINHSVKAGHLRNCHYLKSGQKAYRSNHLPTRNMMSLQMIYDRQKMKGLYLLSISNAIQHWAWQLIRGGWAM